MSIMRVGLVDATGKLDTQLVQDVATALNTQVMRDLAKVWNVSATVIYLPDAKKVPPGVWPVNLVAKLPPGEGGVHMDKNNQPYAKVIATPDSQEWTIDASHETIEMLVDPYGNRLHQSRSITVTPDGAIRDGTGEFSYLVEACDPCEADKYAYGIDGVAVSDFLTPDFYDPVTNSAVRYSFTGAIKAPRQVLPGGYISWIDQEKDVVQQLLWVDPNQPPHILNLGPAPAGRSLRVWVDEQVTAYKHKVGLRRTLNTELLATCARHRQHISKIAAVRGSSWFK